MTADKKDETPAAPVDDARDETKAAAPVEVAPDTEKAAEPVEFDPDVLIRKAEASLRKTESQQPHVDRITSWLKRRENHNGFGEDFEYTLRPNRRHA